MDSYIRLRMKGKIPAGRETAKMRKYKIHIGTSGWHYKHWIGTFYPTGTKDPEQLGHYLRHFKTVELNNSFYRLPDKKTFATWRKSTPEDFIFSVKASRFITHMKKLKDPQAPLQEFFQHALALKEKMGPVLFQLPPGWKLNEERLESFLKQLPQHHRYTFEFRNVTWYTEHVFHLLKTYNAAFCIYELDGHLSPMQITADFVYVRLHGPGGKYQGSYTDKQLAAWGKQCLAWQKEKKDVYVYFDNDQYGYAAFNAVRLLQLIS
jgi:uncharacterized protein YecE (DUF72 family)